MAAQLQPEFDSAPPVKAGKLKKWVPKKWKADYDRVVAYHVMGKTNIEIAEILKYTKEHVCLILSRPQALELKEKLQVALRDRMLTNIPETLDYVARKTVERLKQVVDSDELFEKSPFAVIDRGMDVLKGLQHLKGGGNGSTGTINVERAVFVSGSAAENMFDGFTKSDEARRINASPTPSSSTKQE